MLFIVTEEGTLVNVNKLTSISFEDCGSCWTVFGEVDGKKYTLCTAKDVETALDEIDMITHRILEIGGDIVRMPVDMPF